MRLRTGAEAGGRTGESQDGEVEYSGQLRCVQCLLWQWSSAPPVTPSNPQRLTKATMVATCCKCGVLHHAVGTCTCVTLVRNPLAQEFSMAARLPIMPRAHPTPPCAHPRPARTLQKSLTLSGPKVTSPGPRGEGCTPCTASLVVGSLHSRSMSTGPPSSMVTGRWISCICSILLIDLRAKRAGGEGRGQGPERKARQQAATGGQGQGGNRGRW